METRDKGVSPLQLERLQHELERRIESAARAHEARTGEALQLDMNFAAEEGGDLGDEALRSKIRTIVQAFHREPLVEQAGLRVHKVTALDSDADGRVAVRVQYDYAV